MENIIKSYDSLWDSGMKCKCGVLWKPSVKHFNINAVEEIYRIEDRLKHYKWKDGKPRPIKILYPKKRDGLSIAFKDRVYQRCINDNVLYPAVTRSFIIANCACQKGKGIDFARKLLKKDLWNYFCNYGDDGFILQIDIKEYYASMLHSVVKKKFSRYLDDEVYFMVCNVLDTQYKGDVGYSPGSQMVQIAGISTLDDFDHYCKERLHIKYYIRYMDDILMIGNSKEHLQDVVRAAKIELDKIGFRLNDKKTRITTLKKGFLFLGFNYHLTKTGKVIMTLNGDNVHHERKKLYRLVKLAKNGVITRSKVEQCYSSWKANARKGNSYQLLKRMDEYYYDLWRKETW